MTTLITTLSLAYSVHILYAIHETWKEHKRESMYHKVHVSLYEWVWTLIVILIAPLIVPIYYACKLIRRYRHKSKARQRDEIG